MWCQRHCDLGDEAAWRYVKFFTANIRNPHTRRAYVRVAVSQRNCRFVKIMLDGGFGALVEAARSYYIGLENSMPAVPGSKPPIKALCVVPRGMQEGSELLIEGKDFGVLTGHATEFRCEVAGG
jgi:hypothetical protein